jgi:aryl-alcohol dehydrogenase-like predicted oxidoreductase
VNRKPFGNTGLQVTPIGLGLAALGRPGYINLGHDEDLAGELDVASMRTHSHRVLDEAWRLGVRYFDAARSYGRAEEFLGSWLRARDIPPGEVTVGSKWGYIYTADWQVSAETHEIKEHTLANLDRQIAESRDRLSPYLALYQIHSATKDSGVLDNHEVLARLGELREEGLVIGLSLSGPAQADTLQQALEVVVGGRPLFGSVQATWNLLSQEAGPALQQAHDAGWGVIVKEALANGRLTTRNDDPAFAEQRSRLQQLAAGHETTIDALALAAVLAQPWAGCVLSGATTAEQLTSNVAALNVNWGDDLERLGEQLREAPEAYWARRSRLDWN